MNRSRRALLGGAAIGASLVAAPGLIGRATASRFSPQGGEPFRPLPERDATAAFKLTAQSGKTSFSGGAPSATKGFDGSYLGPTLRMRRDATGRALVRNGTDATISTHWHGLNVPSDADGGAPQSTIAPGAQWRAELPVRQPAATLWYHTHVHGRTAPDVHAGLAGALIIDDDESDALDLPKTAGIDDLVVVLQDKTFDDAGRAVYDPGMMEVMHGFVGDVVLANGQFAPVAQVPAGWVRLRLINACTGALVRIGWSRPARLIATDQGLLAEAVRVEAVSLAPGERAEVVIDMMGGGDERVVARAVQASGMRGRMGMRGGSGMMGGGMMGRDRDRGNGAGGPFQTLISLRAGLPGGLATIPDQLIASTPDPRQDGPTRTFELAAGMGPMNMMRRAIGSQSMTINGQAYDPKRIDFTCRPGAVERWRISGAMMGHPFHAHGVKFRVLEPQRPEEMGWKDTVMVEGVRDVLVQVEAESVERVPFMFHCHILEHEDAGMMGQFLVA